VVFAPSPLLTVTVERQAREGVEIHVHAGGQGFWVARLLAILDVEVTLCGTFAGETGAALETLTRREGVKVRAVPGTEPNGAYVHDRRSAERVPVAEMAPRPLSRHEVDELYGATFVEVLDAEVCVLTGDVVPVVPSDCYRRLAADAGANGKAVVADLSGADLDAAVCGGVSVLKVSDEELVRDRRAASRGAGDLWRAMRDLAHAGAANVIVSRGAEPALALVDGRAWLVVGPSVETVDHRGAGDSMTAGIAAGLCRGEDVITAVRLGAAAGGLNVTRRGLATGNRREIERLMRHVDIRPEGGVP
jgi:1-phosphofructokinase